MRKLLLIFTFHLCFVSIAQTPKKPTSSEIYASIQKLNFLGSVMYVAAHPDDENTDLISYFANDVHAQTAYFSMTRGDGGQNLIGSELRELLGVIRTQELIQARRIDGGLQYFSRANDFGFSKNPHETFEFWDKEQVMRDLVYRIRDFQPDIIINRFDHRTPGTTHGHHTASAILGVEAFDLASDAHAFPEQLETVSVWQPKKLFFNDSWFFYGNTEAFEKADQSDKFGIDIGTFYSSLGLSNGEIAAQSRSSHSSQGFGTSGRRGSSMEYLEPIFGEMPKENIFEGIDTSWNRLEDGAPIAKVLKEVENEYDFRNPSASLPKLLEAYKLIQDLKDSHWREIKTKEIKDIILASVGLYLEAIAESSTAIAGEEVTIALEAINRSSFPIRIEAISINGKESNIQTSLDNNQAWKENMTLQIPSDEPPTNAYWLDKEASLGMYHVGEKELIGLPETPPAFTAIFHLNIDGVTLPIEKPIVYKYTDLAKGELYEPFVVMPMASVAIEEKVQVFGDSNSKTIRVKVKSFTENEKATLRLDAPDNWKITPKSQDVELMRKGSTQYFYFTIYPPKATSEVMVIPQLKIGNKILDREVHELSYSHIPKQRVLLPGKSKLVHIDIDKKGDKVGYIQGAGDEVGDYLKQIGYQVEEIAPEDIQLESIQQYDAIVLGIRAFNVLPELNFKNEILFEYVKNGGNVLVQYNVSRGQLITEDIAPYPLELSTDRVTDENSKVEFINANHPVLNYPNKITQKDFEGWVQERGLYFPKSWNKAFEPLLRMHDHGDSPLEGSILVAKYGKGHYVYTGLSFFRELPAGVPGAYRLFANLLSIGKE